jgi:hypothetical protein
LGRSNTTTSTTGRAMLRSRAPIFQQPASPATPSPQRRSSQSAVDPIRDPTDVTPPPLIAAGNGHWHAAAGEAEADAEQHWTHGWFTSPPRGRRIDDIDGDGDGGESPGCAVSKLCIAMGAGSPGDGARALFPSSAADGGAFAAAAARVQPSYVAIMRYDRCYEGYWLSRAVPLVNPVLKVFVAGQGSAARPASRRHLLTRGVPHAEYGVQTQIDRRHYDVALRGGRVALQQLEVLARRRLEEGQRGDSWRVALFLAFDDKASRGHTAAVVELAMIERGRRGAVGKEERRRRAYLGAQREAARVAMWAAHDAKYAEALSAPAS